MGSRVSEFCLRVREDNGACIVRYAVRWSMKRHNNTFMSNVPDFRKIAPLFEGSQALLACPSGTSSVEMKMSMERWWSGTGGGKSKYRAKNLLYFHFVRHKSHMAWPWIESGFVR